MLVPLLAALLCVGCPGKTSPDARTNDPGYVSPTGTPVRRNRRLPDAVEGVVEHVSDGDTFIIRDDGGSKFTVRMQGIDAPEKGQAFGDRAKSILTGLILKKRVRVIPTKTDQYRRLVGSVELDGRDVCLELLERGAVWHFARFDSELPEGLGERYEEAEKRARSKRAGIWAESDPIPPWEFRDRRRDDESR